jgi:DNA polymerase III gamma/tau subunit
MGEKHLTNDAIEKLLGLPPMERIAQIIGAIGAGDVKSVLAQTDAILMSGLSSDALLAALVDYFRNLLIARLCGQESSLLDIPGLTPKELTEQAAKFDPIVLTQDITILEELRRNMRQNQTGRALLDATLVRLAMAEQFLSINELLSRTDGPAPARSPAAPAPAQKKNPEPVIQREIKGTAPFIPAPVTVRVEEIADASGIWPRLIENLKQHGSAMVGTLALARLSRIEDGQAVISFQRSGATFASTWSSNGKKDAIAKALTELHGRPMGVRFEVDEESATEAPAPSRRAPAPDVESAPMVQAVLREFGGEIIG